MRFNILVAIGWLSLTLTACSSWHHQNNANSSNTAAEPDPVSTCKELKRRMVFNASSVMGENAVQRDMQNQQLRKEYHDRGCDSSS